MGAELALVVSGASGTALARRWAELALGSGAVGRLHVVMTRPAQRVAARELGEEWGSPAGFCASLGLDGELRGRAVAWEDDDLVAPVASGSHRLDSVTVLPCSSGMVGSLANGVSRGLGQRIADVALKQRWPLVIGIRETPMSPILLENLLRLARAGAHIVPPVPAFYIRGEDPLMALIDHYCMRALDLVGIRLDREELRWNG
ncbi:MAG: UbiX family flavin prenyltransferase [Acidobacteria bacterium]|nr:UbiX family flavin prenyltransferase [Acidobacteriota bacterium]